LDLRAKHQWRSFDTAGEARSTASSARVEAGPKDCVSSETNGPAFDRFRTFGGRRPRGPAHVLVLREVLVVVVVGREVARARESLELPRQKQHHRPDGERIQVRRAVHQIPGRLVGVPDGLDRGPHALPHAGRPVGHAPRAPAPRQAEVALGPIVQLQLVVDLENKRDGQGVQQEIEGPVGRADHLRPAFGRDLVLKFVTAVVDAQEGDLTAKVLLPDAARNVTS